MLRHSFVVNDLQMQKVLWDRRLCLRIIDQINVPNPDRLEVNRFGGPRLESAELVPHVNNMTGVTLPGPEHGTTGGQLLARNVVLIDDGGTLLVDGKPFKKPFVEKPVKGDDRYVTIYFPRCCDGGDARRFFRNTGNKSSECDPDLVTPRCITEEGSSYIYKQFLEADNAEYVKMYTVGTDFLLC